MRSAQLLICFLFLSQFTWSQEILPPKGIKYDYFKASKSGQFLAIYKGKKAGIFNTTTQQFDVPLKKQLIIQSPIFDFFTVIKDTGFQTYAAYYSDTLIPMQQDEMYFRYWSDQFYIENLNDGRYIINDAETPDSSRDHWLDDHTYLGSGVYNFKKGYWEIPRSYYRPYKVDDRIVCLKRDSSEFKKTGQFKDRFLFDIYQKSKKGYELISENVNTNDAFLNPIYFQCDTLYEVNPQHYVIVKNKKKGLIRLDPFGWDIRLKKHIFYDELLKAEYDFIWPNPMADGYYVINAESEKKLFYFNEVQDSMSNYQLRQPKVGDYLGWGVYTMDSIRSSYTPFYSTQSELAYSSVQILNDSLVKMTESNEGGNWSIVKSQVNPEEDSIGFDSQPIYNIQGAYDSVWIYNYSSGQMVMEGDYIDVHYTGDTYVAVQDGEVTILNTALEVIDGPFEYRTFFEDEELVKHLFSQSSYEIIERLGGTRNAQYEYNSIFRCTKPNGKMDLFQVNPINITPTTIDLNADFSWYDENTLTGIYLKSNVLVLSMVDTTLMIPMPDSVSIKFDGSSNPFMYVVSSSDSLQNTQLRYIDQAGFNKHQVSLDVLIQQKGDVLLTSISSTREIEVYDDFYYESWGVVDVKLEYACIWKKTKNGVVRQTPYYYSIHPIPNGYLVETGRFLGEIVYDEKGEPMMDEETQWLKLKDDQVARFLLLDENYKAVQMLDYYDFDSIVDLGFGLEVTTSRGKFFATYDGQPITDDRWDQFSLSKSGQLIAIKHSVEFEDSLTGEFIVKDGVMKQFNLPKK